MVFVLDRRQKPLMPCAERRARILLNRGRAVVHRLHPFTIRLRDRVVGESAFQPVRLKVDPGSKHSGIGLVREDGPDKGTVLHLAQIDHKTDVHKRMLQRAGYRRRRRSANLRYRESRFDNRCSEPCAGCGRNARHGSRFCRCCHGAGHRDAGHRATSRLGPSLRCRVDNLTSWVARYRDRAPVSTISMELVSFDTQLLEHPEIAGAEYQQGTLAGFEVREYLLCKFGHTCAYCAGLSGDPILNIEHIVPRSRGGTDRVSNLALACRTCNEDKDDRTPAEWAALLGESNRPLHRARAKSCATVQTRAKAPLRDAAAVNSTRWAVYRALRATGLPVETGSGGRTKWNRTQRGLPKTHALDATCVGTGTPVILNGTDAPVLVIRAVGRGKYQRTNPDASGFPRGYLSRSKTCFGFRSGDLVRAEVPAGRAAAGTHRGSVAVRARGVFRVGHVDSVPARCCRLLARSDGYGYQTTKGGIGVSPSRLKPGAPDAA